MVDRAIIDRNISIHAPRAGSDAERGGAEITSSISIHAPRAGSDTAAGM